MPALSLQRSIQPANPLRLARSVATSFASHSDTLPRLIAALNPVAAPIVYPAWAGVQPEHIQLGIFAPRAKAALFASNFAGASSVNQSSSDESGANVLSTTVSFTAASIANTWKDIVSDKATSLGVIALDSVYDKATVGSWIAVEQPVLDKTNAVVGRKTSFHKVNGVQTATLDTTNGYTAKVSVLTLDSDWIPKMTAQKFTDFIQKPMLLRGTVVYVQSEPLDLAEAPLDRDAEGNSIELDGLYDGLEPGRWIIVSGDRTDIPNVAGVQSSELAMISGVTQGEGKEFCTPFLPNVIPFESLLYISDSNAAGDRLVVGTPAAGVIEMLQKHQIPSSESDNQQFCESIQLCPGVYADAYVPTEAERTGDFTPFAGQLVDPDNPATKLNGKIPPGSDFYAWRIRRLSTGSETVHTTIQLASPLAYKYDSAAINIYANVVKATHGQMTGEVLGNGDGGQTFQTFGLHQKPLTYVSASTPEGAASTLTVRVNDIEWHEGDDLAGLGPRDREYVTRTDDSGQTSITFGNGQHGARVPTGSSNVKATYRYGIGSSGNVPAGRISQLATHPRGAQGVINPLPATGGADRDSIDQVRRNAPLTVMALDRLVSVEDYADFARTYAGIAKARSVAISDGRRQLVHLTVAGVGDIPIDQTSDLYQNLVLSLHKFGDPFTGIQVCVRKAKLLVISGGVHLQPDYLWEAVSPQITATVLAGLSFDARDLGQPAYLSEAIAMIQGVQGVSYVDVDVFDVVSEEIAADAAKLSKLASTLKLNQFLKAEVARLDPTAPADADPCRRIVPAELIYMTPDVPATLILTQIGA